ncbi:50S ribosomal protein L18 [Adhaeribacter rhizoryzae]|uniref:Large ribosomal subunit protein uL18 n=1 Tax=Adhaeribacter rhizoryzae TaxID=2607907 RepID=A0A5M6DPE2_9BACT|nr:50S ribosomal protein L18 [Adhaeribacter rhizoryzae]KAA5549401.1 50S ribosomal protein L18 [Adhaeribacter rhizoryzae]
MAVSKLERRTRIRKSIRSKISGTPERPRLSVFRSNKNIYAQLIDDVAGKTLVAVSSAKFAGEANGKTELSSAVGRELATIAQEKGISEVVFDRSGYLYHGRVKTLADSAREAGLKF